MESNIAWSAPNTAILHPRPKPLKPTLKQTHPLTFGRIGGDQTPGNPKRPVWANTLFEPSPKPPTSTPGSADPAEKRSTGSQHCGRGALLHVAGPWAQHCRASSSLRRLDRFNGAQTGACLEVKRTRNRNNFQYILQVHDVLFSRSSVGVTLNFWRG